MTGSADEVERDYREAFLILERRIGLLSLPIASLDRLAIGKEVWRIGER